MFISGQTAHVSYNCLLPISPFNLKENNNNRNLIRCYKLMTAINNTTSNKT